MNDIDHAGLDELKMVLHRAFDFWNERYWGGALTRPVINFHLLHPNSSRLGHFAPDTWVPRDGRRRVSDEIVLYADLCLERGIDEVIEAFVHEVVHLWQEAFGQPGRWNYHNRRWHDEANRVGLMTKKGDKKGRTTGGVEFYRALREFAPATRRTPHRKSLRKPGKMKKWVCDCGFGVRVAVTTFHAVCQDCGQKFRPAPPRW